MLFRNGRGGDDALETMSFPPVLLRPCASIAQVVQAVEKEAVKTASLFSSPVEAQKVMAVRVSRLHVKFLDQFMQIFGHLGQLSGVAVDFFQHGRLFLAGSGNFLGRCRLVLGPAGNLINIIAELQDRV